MESTHAPADAPAEQSGGILAAPQPTSGAGSRALELEVHTLEPPTDGDAPGTPSNEMQPEPDSGDESYEAADSSSSSSDSEETRATSCTYVSTVCYMQLTLN